MENLSQIGHVNNEKIGWSVTFVFYVLIAYIGSITGLKSFESFRAIFNAGFYTTASPSEKSYLLVDFLSWLLSWPLIILFITSPLLITGRVRRLLILTQIMVLIFMFSVGIKNSYELDELAPLAYFVNFFYVFGIYIMTLCCALFFQKRAASFRKVCKILIRIQLPLCMGTVAIAGFSFYVAYKLPDVMYKEKSFYEVQRLFTSEPTASQLRSCSLMTTLSLFTRVLQEYVAVHCPAVSKDQSFKQEFPFPYITDNELNKAYHSCKVRDVYMPPEDIAGVCIEGMGGFITLNKDRAEFIIANNWNKCGINRVSYIRENAMLKSMRQCR